MNTNIIPMCILFIALLYNIPAFFSKKTKIKKEEKILRTIGGIFLSLTLALISVLPIELTKEDNNYLVLLIYPIIVLLYLGINFYIYIKNYIKIITADFQPIYVREVDVDYSPAVLSLLLNHKIEDKKDLNATILNIHAKGAIKFEDVNNNIYIIDLKDSKAIKSLTIDEHYIYKVLINEEKFSKTKWYDIVKKELEKKKFVRKNEKSIIIQIAKNSFIVFIIIFLFYMLFGMIGALTQSPFMEWLAINYIFKVDIFSLVWILLSICLQFTLLKLLIKIQASNFIEDNAKYYTEKGYIEMLKWKRFINFINEFTTIEDAAIESVVIWDKYIAYAMACNINKTYNSKKLENINKIITNISTE